MSCLASLIEEQLSTLRQQAHDVPMINPPLIIAERLSKDLDQGVLSLEDIEACLADFTRRALLVRTTDARRMLGVSSAEKLAAEQRVAISAYIQKPGNHRYHLVFTAHPVFGLSSPDSQALARCIVDQRAMLPTVTPLQKITLAEEHDRVMVAIAHARQGLLRLNRQLLQVARENGEDWRDTPPIAMNLASWVGYDLDGRDDIRWIDSFCFRLEEKRIILAYYLERLADMSPPTKLHRAMVREYEVTVADIARFTAYQHGKGSLATAANALSERDDKVTDPADWAESLDGLATSSQDADQTLEAVLLAREMRQYSLGIGEIHLRLNALQVRNAMRAVDGRGGSESRGGESSRQLIKRLNVRIATIEPEDVNFHDLDTERATAGRLMMLSKQILKHVDSCQPIRLLVAECERPLTLLSTLYLAKLYKVADKLDISPLFETQPGLERGAEVIEQLMQNTYYRRYVQQRGRLAIQTGFSDAGRFIGQLSATLAIERLQVKFARVHQQYLDDSVALLLFNTHGESFGRGGARGSVRNRQEYIFSPHARQFCTERNIPVIHESSFQGGDGYLWFHDPELAATMVTRLFEAEFLADEADDDPLYAQSDFALDVFLSIKRWHDQLFQNPDYGNLLNLFGNNMLPTTGSRPSKRSSSSLGARQDPSKIRAIVHNALLQQAGYLVNVIGGLGHSAMVDTDRFQELYTRSERFRLLVQHALEAQKLGCTNTLLAYGTLFQRSFWINRAWQATAHWHVRSCRSIADALLNDTRSEAVGRLTTVFCDDLLDLRALQKRLGVNGKSPSDYGRLLIDSHQVIRLVLIMEILFLISRVPRFAEHNATGREDLIRMALRLDIDTVIQVIEDEFGLRVRDICHGDFSEAGRPADHQQRYQEIESRILIPTRRMYAMIKHITMVIGCLYGGHG